MLFIFLYLFTLNAIDKLKKERKSFFSAKGFGFSSIFISYTLVVRCICESDNVNHNLFLSTMVYLCISMCNLNDRGKDLNIYRF